jgi:predicted permease
MLGIGANVVVFGVVNAVLLHPLDVSDPQNLYELRHKTWTYGKLLTTSYPAYEDYRQRNTTFSGIAAFDGYAYARLSWGNSTKSVNGYAVTGNYFDLLGVQPEVGRFIEVSDDHGPKSAPYVVLSDNLWRSVFNADSSVIGKTVLLDKGPFTVIGVAPARFHGTEQFDWPDYFIPIVNFFEADFFHNRTTPWLTVIGRLKSGVTPEQATENLNAIASQLAMEYPETDSGLALRLVRPGLNAETGDVIRGFLYGVTGLALLVLVAACANLASLFAARSADRSRELAVRIALGASHWRLVRQLMTEAILVSMMGGIAGLLIARLLLDVLNRWQLSNSNFTFTHVVDGRVYAVALVLTLFSAVLFGMLPAKTMWQRSPLQAMKSGPVDSTPVRQFVLRDLLLGVQIAICTLLVTASLVAVRGMVRMLHAPLGFQPQGAMVADMDLRLVEGGVPPEKNKAMIETVRNIPGVVAVGMISRVPFTGGLRGVPVYPPGTTEFTLNNSVLASYAFTMSPGYLEAADTRLLSGRDFSWHDTATTPHVAMVNQTFARKMWGNTSAIGQHFFLRREGVPIDFVEVVGVVEDGKYHDMQESPQPVAYLSSSQNEQSHMIFVVRSHWTQNEIAAALERTLSGLEPNAQITVQSWPEALSDMLFPARAATVALGTMGLLAAMLAVTGIFGMAAYNVSRRMKELGIRVALGARAKHVMSTAVGRPIALLVVGSLLGLMSGVLASRLLGNIVYQANPRDPVVVIGAVLTMALLGIAASAIPALRALAVDPSKLLREE